MMDYASACYRRRLARERRETLTVWGVGLWTAALLLAGKLLPGGW